MSCSPGKYSGFITLPLLFTLGHIQASETEKELTFIPSLSSGYYNFKYDSNFGQFDITSPFYNVGIAIVHPRISVSLNYLDFLSKDDDRLNDALGVVEFDRYDLDLTISVPINQEVSVFAGYITSEYEATSNELFPQLSLGDAAYIQDWDEKGLYVGAAYKWKLGTGALTASLAYAALDISVTDNFPAPQLEVEGDTTGLSFGLRWFDLFTDNLGYTASFLIRRYDLDANTISSVDSLPGVGAINRDSFNADWDSQLIGLGLFYLF